MAQIVRPIRFDHIRKERRNRRKRERAQLRRCAEEKNPLRKTAQCVSYGCEPLTMWDASFDGFDNDNREPQQGKPP
jgi:hypothetical protein